MTDDRPLSSDEMLRRAREGVTRPMESPTPSEEAHPAMPSPPATRPMAKSPRLRPPPHPAPVNPAQTRVIAAIAVAIAIIGAGVAILIATAGSAP